MQANSRSGTEVVGAVVAHALRCGAGAGAFLRVRECELLLLAAPARGAMQPAPYLDSYGETDQVRRSCGFFLFWQFHIFFSFDFDYFFLIFLFSILSIF